jgi:hypothetical protein
MLCMIETRRPVRLKTPADFPRAPGMGGRGMTVGDIASVFSTSLRCEVTVACVPPGLLDPLSDPSAGIGWVQPALPPPFTLPRIPHSGGAYWRCARCDVDVGHVIRGFCVVMRASGVTPYGVLEAGFVVVPPTELELDRGYHGSGLGVRRAAAGIELGGYAMAIASEPFPTHRRSQWTVRIMGCPGDDVFVGVVADIRGAQQAPNFSGGGWFPNGPLGWGYCGRDGTKRHNGAWVPGATTATFGAGSRVRCLPLAMAVMRDVELAAALMIPCGVAVCVCR